MRTAFATRLGVVVVPLLILVGGVYSYDVSEADTLAQGTRVGGVEVGGLSEREARERVRSAVLNPLRRPIVVRAGDREFRLTAREARIHADVARAVRAGRERSRRDGLLVRTWRELSGGGVSVDVSPKVTYSRVAVQRLTDRVRVKMRRKPVSASAEIGVRRIAIGRGRPGRRVPARRLRSAIERALLDPAADRVIRVPLLPVRPEVTEKDARARHATVITVDRDAFRLRLFKDLELVESYPIALGQAGQETPSGVYEIANKAVDPTWIVPNADWAGELAGRVIPPGPDNPLKARWLGIYDGVGIHGTSDRSTIGANASRGCIRMYVEDVKKLYARVPVGTPIRIA